MSIFVSYSHQDKLFVDKLCTNLMLQKFHLWIDRWELKPGDSLIDSIQGALGHAGAILVIISKSYIDSPWCKKEMNAGLIRELKDRGNIIIPVLIEDCDIPLFLQEKMYADFRSNFDDAYTTLLESLSKYTNLDQGRLDNPTFYVDYSSEYLREEDKIIGLRYQFVEHAENRPYTVLSIVYITFNPQWQNNFADLLIKGYENVVRYIMSTFIIDFLESNEVKVALKDAFPITKKIDILDKTGNRSVSLNFEIRWMGEDTGKTIIYWASESMKGALNQYMSKIKPPSATENEHVLSMIHSFFRGNK